MSEPPLSTREHARQIIEETRETLGSRPFDDQGRVYLKGIFNLLALIIPEMLYEKEQRKEPVSKGPTTPTFKQSGVDSYSGY